MAANPEQVNAIVHFWSTYGPIVTGGAIIISTICAIIVITTNRAIARKRATLDLIMHIESDGDLIRARNAFIGLKGGSQRSAHWGQEAQKDTEEAKDIRTVLNVNELIAVSIREGVIDERVFRRWFNGAYIDDWQSMTGYLTEVRRYKGNPNIFCEFEALARKWEDDKGWNSPPGWFGRKWGALQRVIRA